jgi:hypothetical protein
MTAAAINMLSEEVNRLKAENEKYKEALHGVCECYKVSVNEIDAYNKASFLAKEALKNSK